MWATIKQVRFTKWLSLLCFLALIYFIQNSYFSLQRWLTDQESVPLSELILTGDRAHISFADVRNVIVAQKERLNFFTIEIGQVQKDLEAMPWIYSVSIRKRWPDTLKIHIVEQAIVATWNDKALLNRFGEIIETPPDDKTVSYVALSGEDAHANDVLTTYMEIHQLLIANNFNIVSLSSDKRQSTALVLQNGIILRLGKEQKLDRVQQFLSVYPLISKKYDAREIDYVDLRYDTGFAVGWKKSN